MGYRGRDVEVVPLDEGRCIVTACDSCGAIGSKELDVVRVSPYIVGRFTARVSLMEVMAVGAEPRIICASVSNEPSPTGEGIVHGIKDELRSLGLTGLPLSISTEKNIPTRQTALGIVVVGSCEKHKIRIGMSRPGDILYCLGIPKVGGEVEDPEDNEMARGGHILELSSMGNVRDIVPVGSKGILGEAKILAESSGCQFTLELEGDIDVNKSAGPSTCVIFTCSNPGDFQQFSPAPLTKIGRLHTDAKIQ